MQFIAPIGFLALAGLIIPVLIHLWNVKQGKTLKIGSIAFLGENATASSKSLKLTDLLLFTLRCLVVMLIAFLLAQPIFKKTTVTKKQKGWILIDQAKIGKTYKVYKKTIDSLINEGFELRNFNVGFNIFSLNDSTEISASTSKLKYNALLNQLNKEMPSGYSAYVFADRRLANFDGALPPLKFNLIWKEMKESDTLKTWSSKFLGKVFHAKSTPHLTNYSTDRYKNLSAINVMIYDPLEEDSKYIKAALGAIADFTKRKIEIVKSPSQADVVFWLSDQSGPSERRKVNSRLISYRKGRLKKISSTLNLNTGIDQALELKKRIAFDNLKGTVIWQDGYGEPLLIKDATNNHFHFYSRFDPQWSDLVWNEQFVKALIPIILDNQGDDDFGFEDNDSDQRIVTTTQFSSKVAPVSVNISTIKNIDQLLWILAFAALISERIVSFRHKKIGYAKN